MQGKLIIFSAPSGAGKTTIVRHLLEQPLPLAFSVSATSRAKREGEQDGKDYWFLTVEEFKNRVEKGDFLEWEEVYPNQFYGTLRSEIERVHAQGNHVLFDLDVVGGLNLKRQFGERALAIFVMPPSVQELENRLRSRSTESEESLQKRVAKAASELEYSKHFDRVVHNDNLEDAQQTAINLVKAFIDA
jgi:guanylate kinase